MEQETKRIIEVNGVKVEIDLRQAKQIETFAVGDTVKVFEKQYNDSYEVFPGVITGFAQCLDFASIEVIIMRVSYSEVKFENISINSGSTKYVLATFTQYDGMLNKERIMKALDEKINSAEIALETAKRNKELFLSEIGKKIFMNMEPKEQQ